MWRILQFGVVIAAVIELCVSPGLELFAGVVVGYCLGAVAFDLADLVTSRTKTEQ